VGASQGALAGLVFWVLGLPSPVLWGVVTALFSLIPLIGSAAVWGPAVIVLAVGGHWVKALILLGLGAGVIGQVDGLVRPFVISERTKLNTLPVFFGAGATVPDSKDVLAKEGLQLCNHPAPENGSSRIVCG
jgi:predicted PurR-regulated permease PerM